MRDLGSLKKTIDTHVFAYAGSLNIDGKIYLVVAYETNAKTSHSLEMKAVDSDQEIRVVLDAIGKAEQKRKEKHVSDIGENFGTSPAIKKAEKPLDLFG
jgi:hypothetical protein